jgi:hypothetical protein
MLSVIIDGKVIKEGDWVVAEINDRDQFTNCRVHIQEEKDERDGEMCTKIYLCQDEHDGDSCNEENRYGFHYSWSAAISESGKIVTDDTFSIVPTRVEEPTVVSDIKYEEDEDIMPEDWVMDEIIPADL